jgi:hypothetical protein
MTAYYVEGLPVLRISDTGMAHIIEKSGEGSIERVCSVSDLELHVATISSGIEAWHLSRLRRLAPRRAP